MESLTFMGTSLVCPPGSFKTSYYKKAIAVRARGVQTLQGQGVLVRVYDERVALFLSRRIRYIYGPSRARSRLPGQDSAVSAVRCRAVACLIALPLWAGAIRRLRLLVYSVPAPAPIAHLPLSRCPTTIANLNLWNVAADGISRA